MDDNETLRYRVNVKSLKPYPAIGPEGSFTQAVTFHVKPLDNGIEFDFDGGLVGGETLRRCQLLQERIHIVVEFVSTWRHTWPGDWQKQIVEVALEQAAQDV